jgi:hypothetical protein
MPTTEELYYAEVCVSCKYFFDELCLRYPPMVSHHEDGSPRYGECPHVPARHYCGEYKRVDSVKIVEERLEDLRELSNARNEELAKGKIGEKMKKISKQTMESIIQGFVEADSRIVSSACNLNDDQRIFALGKTDGLYFGIRIIANALDFPILPDETIENYYKRLNETTNKGSD